MNDRRAERYDPRDADPLTVAMCYERAPGRTALVCTLPEGHIADHDWFWFRSVVEQRDRETREEFRSGFVIVWLILAIVAGAAIAWLWWTFR